MWQAMLHLYPQTQAEYIFICRSARDYPLTHLIAELNEQLDHLCTLRFQLDEPACLRGLRFIKARLCDSPGKILFDDQAFLAYLRQVFSVPAIG